GQSRRHDLPGPARRMTGLLPTPAPLAYRTMTPEEWRDYPKDDFAALIRRWCDRHGYVLYVALGKKVPARLPYRRNDAGMVEVAEDFLQMADRWRMRRL